MAFFQETIYQKIKYGAFVINLNDKNTLETHWVSLLIDKNTTAYFDSFETEYVYSSRSIKQNQK